MELGKQRNGYNATIKCEVCGSMFEKISPTHLRRHGMTMAQYMEQFPGAPIIPESERVAASERVTGSANPGFQHGGKLSPYSPKFVGTYDPDIAKKSAANKRARGNDNTVMEYYTSRGMTESEASEALAKRQSTFSLDKMIEKHGEIEGRKKWAKRQEKWLASMPRNNYSKISQELFNALLLSGYSDDVYFATHINPNDSNDKPGKEYRMRIGDKLVLPDFVDLNSKKVIEFDGDYWHSERIANPSKEAERQSLIESHGFSVLRIKERDYNKDKHGTVDKCLIFLTS